MAKVYAFAANGTEETELFAVVDILRRAKIETLITSVEGKRLIGSHGIAIAADVCISDCDLSDADVLYLPGGIPGAVKLAECEPLCRAVRTQLEAGKRVAAICAAPALCLGEKGLLDGKRATCHPDFARRMSGALLETDVHVITDGNITTAPGMGCSVDMGLELVRLLCGDEPAWEIGKKLVYF